MWKKVGFCMVAIPIGVAFGILIVENPLAVGLILFGTVFGVFWIWTGIALFCGTPPREIMDGWKYLLRLP